MICLDLVRMVSTDKGTHGLLTVPGHLSPFHVCEDPVREPARPEDLKDVEAWVSTWKIKGCTAIPYGFYAIGWTMSTRFKRHTLQLLDVPGFGGIRIHSGNTAADTEGCLLPGLRGARDGIGVLDSRAAVGTIEDLLVPAIKAGTPVQITIRRPI